MTFRPLFHHGGWGKRIQVTLNHLYIYQLCELVGDCQLLHPFKAILVSSQVCLNSFVLSFFTFLFRDFSHTKNDLIIMISSCLFYYLHDLKILFLNVVSKVVIIQLFLPFDSFSMFSSETKFSDIMIFQIVLKFIGFDHSNLFQS